MSLGLNQTYLNTIQVLSNTLTCWICTKSEFDAGVQKNQKKKTNQKNFFEKKMKKKKKKKKKFFLMKMKKISIEKNDSFKK